MNVRHELTMKCTTRLNEHSFREFPYRHSKESLFMTVIEELPLFSQVCIRPFTLLTHRAESPWTNSARSSKSEQWYLREVSIKIHFFINHSENLKYYLSGDRYLSDANKFVNDDIVDIKIQLFRLVGNDNKLDLRSKWVYVSSAYSS